MHFEHATEEVIARANIVEVGANEDDQAVEPRIMNLYLDTDGNYRWYDEEDPTSAEGDRIHSALAAGRLEWPGFEVVEVRGQTFTSPEDVEDSFASDELEALRKNAQ